MEPWFNLENAVTELQGQIGEKGSVLMITEGNLDSRIELAYLKPTNDVRFALDYLLINLLNHFTF